MRRTLITFFFLPMALSGYTQNVLRLTAASKNVDLRPFLEILTDTTGNLTFDQVVKSSPGEFKSIQQGQIDYKAPVHWLKFTLFNEFPSERTFNLTVTFTDYASLFGEVEGRGYLIEKSGDLVDLSQRSRGVGKLVVMKVKVPEGRPQTYYLKLESKTGLSQQFKPFALGAIRLYSNAGYTSRFETVRIYSALFYGALIIMLLYNFFIYLSLKDKSYLYYVFFIFFLLIFLLADDGILAELFFYNDLRTDLYIRFLSPPVLVICFLVFSRSFLKSDDFLPKTRVIHRLLIGGLMLVVFFMLTGQWYWGRSLSIITTVISFVFILGSGLGVLKKGYGPARYFLAANLLLLLGGMVFALQRFSVVSQNPLTQYSIQISAALQVALFSLGLADRINLIRKELTEKTLENERLERQKEAELIRMTEEKNQELEHRVHLRTIEVVEQKEEIEAQKEFLVQYNEELEKAQMVIKNQNEELSTMNSWLEAQVKDRTKKLKLSNEELQNALAELDNFIYKTAHDIRGPLARLMGLCNVALLDVTDEKAKSYFTLLDKNASHLNIILSRLSIIHKINNLETDLQLIDFKAVITNVLKDNELQPGFEALLIETDIQEGILFYADPYLVKLILGNLIENAIKYADSGEKTHSFVKIKIRKVRRFIEIDVIDNGIGIKESEIPCIFEMFSKAADVHQSAGLGLYMVKISVKKLKGSIEVKKDPVNHYTHFFLRFPILIEKPSLKENSLS